MIHFYVLLYTPLPELLRAMRTPLLRRHASRAYAHYVMRIGAFRDRPLLLC